MRPLRTLSIVIFLAAGLCGGAARADSASDATATAQSAATAASAASAAASAVAAPAKPVLTYVPELTLWFVLGLFVLGVGVPIKKLSSAASGWSLADALSEKAVASAPVAVNAAVAVVPAGALAPAPAADPGTTGSASASRLVAFLGTIAILTMFMGFSLYAIWAAFNGKGTEARDTLKAMSSYLLYGSAMYAPYAFNQVKAAFGS